MDNKILFGIMTIIFNSIGVPCFMQGYTKTGILRIVLFIIPFAGQVFAIINGVMGIIQGIKILQMTDEEYAEKKATIGMGIPKIPVAQ